MSHAYRTLAALALAGAACISHAAPSVTATPMPPTYGQSVSVQMTNADWAPYVPATRYWMQGNKIVLEYEYAPNNFDATRNDFGYRALVLGELPAGNYTLEARLYDMAHPGSAPQVVASQFPVAPPEAWGLYTVPMQPASYQPSWVMLRSAAYFDPSSMRATVNGTTIRVDFDYAPDAPTGGSNLPAGYSSFGAVKVAGMAPGRWTIEGWGRATTTGAVDKFFTREVVVGGPSTVVEYYAPSLDHYFISAGPDEIAGLDANPQQGWLRTGEKFRAWLKAADAPASARPVCRFYSRGANSHFYTGDPSECQSLKSLEATQRAEAQAKSAAFEGWQFEGIAFYALVPVNGACPSGSDPVYRAYNDRAAEMDSNHRFTVDARLRSAMAWTWVDEGVAFCSPS